mmetsp:Transcript_1599/g.3635  ORF Transcript_1599/g.3635 Transcript_1599/m.3635 type:complete len:234 (-) Transcript_1599:625-1326(-)
MEAANFRSRGLRIAASGSEEQTERIVTRANFALLAIAACTLPRAPGEKRKGEWPPSVLNQCNHMCAIETQRTRPLLTRSWRTTLSEAWRQGTVDLTAKAEKNRLRDAAVQVCGGGLRQRQLLLEVGRWTHHCAGRHVQLLAIGVQVLPRGPNDRFEQCLPRGEKLPLVHKNHALLGAIAVGVDGGQRHCFAGTAKLVADWCRPLVLLRIWLGQNRPAVRRRQGGGVRIGPGKI